MTVVCLEKHRPGRRFVLGHTRRENVQGRRVLSYKCMYMRLKMLRKSTKNGTLLECVIIGRKIPI